MNQTARVEEPMREGAVLYLSIELGWSKWHLAFATQRGERPRLRSVDARDLPALRTELELGKQRFGLPAQARIVSCYEAGRDGFWLHRCLSSWGVENRIVDSSSIEVNRRARRAKSDGVDVEKLLGLLIRHDQGEKKVWSVVRVPSIEEEDARQLPRELEALKKERTRHRNRLRGLLASQGLDMSLGKGFVERLAQARQWDDHPVGPGLRARLEREYARLEGVQEQIHRLEKQRREEVAESSEPALERVRQLLLLKAIGINSAWLFVREFFGWRKFRNRREVGALGGLAPTPYQSGDRLNREQGIGAGNGRVRSMMIEIAWGWLRLQPRSQLSQWFQQRFGGGNSRSRRVGIVALARKLLVALWRYLETGEIPQGAELKAA